MGGGGCYSEPRFARGLFGDSGDEGLEERFRLIRDETDAPAQASPTRSLVRGTLAGPATGERTRRSGPRGTVPIRQGRWRLMVDGWTLVYPCARRRSYYGRRQIRARGVRLCMEKAVKPWDGRMA
jgi:hypothetical protein